MASLSWSSLRHEMGDGDKRETVSIPLLRPAIAAVP